LLCYQKKIDVLLSPEFNTPLYTTCKRVVIAHDAHMRVHRQFTNYVWFYGYYIPFIETAIRRCDLIFTVSRFAKKQIAALMRVDERKIVVAYNGIDSHFTKISDDETRHKTISKKGLSDKEYILFVGTFEARKNIERLIEAFALVKKNQITNIANMKLAVVGKTASSRFSDRSKQINDLIYRLKLQKDIILCGYVPDDDLPHFYKSACMVVFPSLNEGFGFPVIEGFASSVPVLTSNTCSMPEIAGGAAILVDPESATDIAEKIELLLTDTALRKRLILAGKQRVKEFTWESCASQIISRVRLLISR
jgi:glycosyltransferase involved in cell wall biosynthesis